MNSNEKRLRRRINDLEQEIALLRDRARLHVLNQPYPRNRDALLQDMNPRPERLLPARDPQPKQGWWRSILGGFKDMFA